MAYKLTSQLRGEKEEKLKPRYRLTSQLKQEQPLPTPPPIKVTDPIKEAALSATMKSPGSRQSFERWNPTGLTPERPASNLEKAAVFTGTILSKAEEVAGGKKNKEMLGIPTVLNPERKRVDEQIFQSFSPGVQTTANVLGTIGGLALPTKAAYGTLGKGAVAGLSRLAPNAGKLLAEGVRGAAAGAGVGAYEGYQAGDPLSEIGKKAAYGALGGAILDPAFMKLGQVAGRFLRKPAQIAEETLDSAKPAESKPWITDDVAEKLYSRKTPLYADLSQIPNPAPRYAGQPRDIGMIKFKDLSQIKPPKGSKAVNKPLESPLSPPKAQPNRNTPEPPLKTVTDEATAVGNAETFRAKVNRDAKSKPSTIGEKFNKLRTQFVDSAAPFEVVEKKVRGFIESAEKSLYKTARLFKGSPEKAHEIIRTELRPIVQEIEGKGYTYKDLGDYALAVHAKDVNARGMKSGFSDAEINSVIQKYGTPEMEAARQKLVNLSSKLLDDLAGAGRISAEDVAMLRQKWPNYMPLFRSFDDAKVEFGKGIRESFANVASPIKRLQGSDRDVIDPIESMIKNVFKITNTADRTRVGGQLLRLADEDATGQFVRRLNPGEEVGRKNVLALHEGGKEVKVEVQPEVYKAMLDLDKESANMLITILSKPASLLRAGATLTPEFSLRNPMRDVLQAYVVSKSGFNPVSDFPAALVQAIFKGRKFTFLGKEITTPGELYQQFLKDNAGYGNIISMDRNVHRQALETVIKKPTWKKFVNVVNPRSWVNVLQAISDTTETATKLGEYRAALKSGATRQEAAYRARDLMDFARAGTSIKQANRVVAFMNAGIQGKSKLIRAIKEDPVGVTTRAVKAITLPTIGVYLSQKYLADDKQRQMIDDAPDWLKDTFWLIPVPGTDQVARIPKPFDLAPLFANSIERLLSYVDKNDPEAFDGYFKQTMSSMSIPVMLTGLTPIIEGMANYSFFRQGSIIPQREQNVEFKDQYDIDTTETAKFIAKGANLLTGGEGTFKNFSSPRVMDNTIRGYTAGLGSLITGVIDVVVDGLSEGGPEKPDRPVSQIPIVRAFLVNELSPGKSMDKFYRDLDLMRRGKGSAKLNKKQYDLGSTLKRAEGVADRLSEINKQIRKVENDPQLDGGVKKRMIADLSAERNQLVRDARAKLKRP